MGMITGSRESAAPRTAVWTNRVSNATGSPLDLPLDDSTALVRLAVLNLDASATGTDDKS